MKTKIKLESWNRKTHFDFFTKFDEPFFGITASVDCTKAYHTAKQNQNSFFLFYLHKILTAVNQVENFKYRILDGEVWEYQKINASPTIMREDKTFGFAWIEFFDDYTEFELNALAEIERVKKTPGLITRNFEDEYNLIHFSSIPWINFTSVSHSRNFSFPDSCPKITTGKLTEENGKLNLPISVHVHHGLADGYHVGLFFEKLQFLMNQSE